MEFHDFQIRAWQGDATHAQVLVHSSPVGDMREPVTVPLALDQLEVLRQLFGDRWGQPMVDWQQLIDGGRQLAAILLPSPVFSRLPRSLEHIPGDDGLRIRLCLDKALIDLPWEYLVRPDASDKALKNFLALDARISLVREAARVLPKVQPTRRRQRLLFAGAPFCVNGVDLWEVEKEHQQLLEALQPVHDLLTIQTIHAPETSFEKGLAGAQLDIFHYSGHTDVIGGQGALLEAIRTDPVTDANYIIWENPAYRASYGVDRLYLDPLSSDRLAQLLRSAGVRMAVFSACNSGRWAFVKPLICEGIPVVVGTQGYASVAVSIAFCHTLYSALATGLSLDEAVTWARLHLLELGVLPKEQQWQWGAFMVYMLTQDATLFPKPNQGRAGERQTVARHERKQTIINVYQTIGTVYGGQVVGVQKNSN